MLGHGPGRFKTHDSPRTGLESRAIEQARTPGSERRERFLTDVWPLLLLLAGLLLAVLLPWLAWDRYGGDETWPSLITNFSSTCLAFLIALAWDRRQRAFADRRELEAEQRREEAEARAEHERRTIEARRRFSAVALELERIEASLQRAHAEQHRYKVFFPDLPSGSWRAASAPLGRIVSAYGLMADLATFYGHVAELQWRLRFKAEPATAEDAINPLIDALVLAMLSDVEELLPQVRRQVAEPDVERVHGELVGGTVVGRRQFTAAIRVVGDDASPADDARGGSS